MIVRRPLVPCSIASHSISRSQTCQSGLAHLPATKPKSSAVMPPPSIRFTNRCPSTRMTSASPDSRMNSQLYSSKLVWPERFRPPPFSERSLELLRGAAISAISASEHVGQMADDERHEQHDPDHADADHQLALVARALGPEVDQDQPDAVERVEQDRGHQPDLEQT